VRLDQAQDKAGDGKYEVLETLALVILFIFFFFFFLVMLLLRPPLAAALCALFSRDLWCPLKTDMTLWLGVA
jgi:hypothetical protein